MDYLSFSERLMYSTVRIECNTGTGTGFFFKLLENGENHIPVIVTNKHVVEGAVTGKFLLTIADENRNPLNTEHFTVELDDFQNRWVFHPEEEIDLCVMPIAPIISEMNAKGYNPYFISLDTGLIPKAGQKDEFKAIENIIMVGYPNGIWDKINNLPVMRKGITATHPKFDYNGLPQLMIDAACFPGSSGSPVFIFDENGYTDKRGNINIGTPRILLLGVLFAGPQYTAQGGIHVVNIPTSQREVVLSSIPNNLGYVIKADKLLDFEKLFS